MRRIGKWGCGLLLLLILGGVGAAALGGDAAAPGPHTVVYRVTGDAPRASLTLTNEQGGTEQEDVRLPWERTLSVPDGGQGYLSAQNAGERGRVICEITVDGKPWRRSQSGAAFGLAECSGLVGVD